MYKLNLYVLVEPRNVQACPKGWFYCLEYGIRRIYGSGTGVLTLHQATLKAICAGLNRLTQNSEVQIYCEDRFVTDSMTGTFSNPSALMKWAERDFAKEDGSPIASAEEWRTIWKKKAGHNLVAVPVASEDRKWLEAIVKEPEKAAGQNG